MWKRGHVRLCMCESLYVCVHLGVNMRICVNIRACGCVYDWAREREKVVGELKHQRADLPQLDPSMLCLELPRWRLFLIFHMPLTQLLHFLGRRMECAQSRRALRDVWLSGLFKGQETRGWSFAHGLIWIHISPYTHPYVPCPQNKQTAELAFTTPVSGQSWHWEKLEEKKEAGKGLTSPESLLLDRHHVSPFIGREVKVEWVQCPALSHTARRERTRLQILSTNHTALQNLVGDSRAFYFVPPNLGQHFD